MGLRFCGRNFDGFYEGDEPKPWCAVVGERIAAMIINRYKKREPNFRIGNDPWPFVSVVLRGGYFDVTKDDKGFIIQARRRPAGSVGYRSATHAHRVRLFWNYAQDVHGNPVMVEEETWTVCFIGPRIREWGFYCPQGWRHWKDFVKIVPGGNERGRGCE